MLISHKKNVCSQITSTKLDILVEMPLRSHHHHQLAKQLGQGHNPPLRSQLIQAAPTANATSKPSPRLSRHQRHRQIDGPEHPSRQTEAQSGQVRRPARLERDPDLFPRLRATELLHQDPRGQSEGCHQTTVR